jgi:hypothetical protein
VIEGKDRGRCGLRPVEPDTFSDRFDVLVVEAEQVVVMRPDQRRLVVLELVGVPFD